MRTEGCEARTLRALASMPFLDRTEMVAVTGWSKAALWERLTLLNRSQNWLAREVGVSPGYISMLVNAGRTPSGLHSPPDAQGPGFRRLRPTFHYGG